MLIAARRQLGLTQTEMGQRLGAKLRTVQHWEKGTRRIPLSAAMLLSAFYIVPKSEKTRKKTMNEKISRDA